MEKKTFGFISHIEELIAAIAIVALVIFLTLDIVLRLLRTSIPNSFLYIKNLVVWLTLASMLVTTKQKKHLSVSLGLHEKNEKLKIAADTIVSFISVTIATVLTICAVSFFFGFSPVETIGVIPVYFVIIIVPAGFLGLLLRIIHQSPKKPGLRIIVLLGIFLGVFIGIKEILFIAQNAASIIQPGNETLFNSFQKAISNADAFYKPFMKVFLLPFLVIFIASAFFGTPIFIVLGGLAVLFFAGVGDIGGLSSISLGAYDTLCRDEMAAIPLFTLAGFILSSSRAGERFVKFLQAVIGWIPGGLAIVTILICAFFTTFTGASGITILALGGLLAGILANKNYSLKFSHGLITGVGSIGLLFPPSLPLIMYGVASMVSIKDLFIGAFLPGVLIIVSLIVIVIVYAIRNKVERVPFKPADIPRPFLEAFWDLLLPVIILIAFFTGIITLVETSAVAVIYVFIIEVFVYKDISLSDIPAVISKSLPVVGGVLIIIAMASGLQSFIVDQQVPQKLAEWCYTFIKSPIVFLLLLNVLLLLTGCVMDIYSAIIVVAPLIIPLGSIYGINKVHLGVIFLSNLMLGFLTPPVGLNLFIASYRFEEPLTKITRYAMPFFFVMLVAVIVITYVPWLSTCFLGQ
jgi:C4-dicarboxylate transporter, DctM subunit